MPPGTGEMLVNVRNMREVRVEDVSIPAPGHRGRARGCQSGRCDRGLPGERQFASAGVFRKPWIRRSGLSISKIWHCSTDLAKSEGFEILGMMRDLLYAPPSMRISVLLQKMQAERVHMALVIDEYGGVDGLVTIEDLVEQIVGEISRRARH